jgi:formylmethanofuran dehydrogenase subunit A
MDRGFRNDMLQKLHPGAQAATILGTLKREYSLYEIAIMTRAGPARSLGLADRGHLGAGAAADITVYEDNAADREAMFAKPELVFKGGEVIVRNGIIVKTVQGATHVARPEYDRAIEKPLRAYFDRYHTMSMTNIRVGDDEIVGHDKGAIVVQPTGPRTKAA